MNKPNVYIIGDCHAVRVLQHGRNNKISEMANVTIWGRKGLNCWNLDFYDMTSNNDISSPLETEVCRDLEIGFTEIKDDGLIMPWIGYIDIRQFLPKYNNADTVIKKYVDHVLKMFPNSEIKFIEPLPQFTEMHMKYEGFNTFYTYEERQKQNYLFISSLRSYCAELGLPTPVNQDKIYDIVGTKDFTSDLVPKNRPHPVDALLDQYYGKIYNLFIEEAMSHYGLNKL